MNLPDGLKTAEFRIPLRFDVSLARYSTFQIGGPARYFAEPTTSEELELLLQFARQEKIPFLAIGKGSNLLFPDEGFPGLVATLIHFEPERIVFDKTNYTVTVSSGIHLYRLALAARDQGFGGLEFLSHIPGTVGGALVMNAGFSRFPGRKMEIGDFVQEVSALTPAGEAVRLGRESLEFSYRKSNLEGLVLLGAQLKLFPRDREEIQKEIQANFSYRNKVQDVRYPSVGSVFKNPPGDSGSAGQLIDRAGLKGKRIGGAMISPRHANFIVNVGGARATDVLRLIELVQEKVSELFGVRLEPEVRLLRNWAEQPQS
ncbi:MAG: UDP-N-acetylmuramate dehydrogenase [Candidatus Omnitrophica bacterium]|nr:UDP-N-acetylmuramate dehydrogenase [Candidatus Omnitrophota bacterium]